MTSLSNLRALLGLLTLYVVMTSGFGASLSKDKKPGQEKDFPKPNFPLHKMDPVDACLFICPDCYEEPLLLDCANKVCLNDVLMGNKIDRFWLEDCPGLKRLPGAV